MSRHKRTARKYTKTQRQEILKRVQAGETQVAVAASAGVPLATVGYWTRKAKNSSPAANGASRPKAKRGRPAGSRIRSSTASSRSGEIAWALDGDTLVIRIPLPVFARQIAEEAQERNVSLQAPLIVDKGAVPGHHLTHRCGIRSEAKGLLHAPEDHHVGVRGSTSEFREER